jgi:hypothetical protein
MTFHALGNHAVKLLTLFGIGARDAIVSEYPGKLPFLIFLYEIRIMFYLCIITGSLFIAVSTNTAVRCDPELRLYFFIYGISHTPSCRDNCDTLIHVSSPHFQLSCRHILPVQMDL